MGVFPLHAHFLIIKKIEPSSTVPDYGLSENSTKVKGIAILSFVNPMRV